jgi:signal transduction histidine kinase
MMNGSSHITLSDVSSSRRLGRMLLAASFGTILLFVLSALVANSRERGIVRSAQSITDDALPAIQHLAGARTALRQVDIALDDLTGAPSSTSTPAAARAELQRSRDLLDREWRDYKALPPYRGEVPLQGTTESSRRAAQKSLDEVVARLRAGRPEAARNARIARAAQDMERLDGGLHALLDLNAARAAERGRLIALARRQSRGLTFSLYGLSTLFAVAAGLLVVSVVRRVGRFTDLRLSELEHFAGRVAHDIRSPLGSVGMALELARKDEHLDEKARARLERSGRTVQRIGQLVDGLLVFAAAGGPGRDGARADVREVLEGVVEGTQPRAEEKDIDLRIDMMGEGAVACSPGVLTSLFTNLIGNAIKYMGDAAVRRVVVRAGDVGAMMRIEVEDTGPGVPPELRPRVFDPHVRGGGSEVWGLGLGLATVRRLVEAHGGSVGVAANREGGSLFWFQLPKAPPPADAPCGAVSSVRSFREVVRPPAGQRAASSSTWR